MMAPEQTRAERSRCVCPRTCRDRFVDNPLSLLSPSISLHRSTLSLHSTPYPASATQVTLKLTPTLPLTMVLAPCDSPPLSLMTCMAKVSFRSRCLA